MRRIVEIALRPFVTHPGQRAIYATLLVAAIRFARKHAVGQRQVVFRTELMPGETLEITTRRAD